MQLFTPSHMRNIIAGFTVLAVSLGAVGQTLESAYVLAEPLQYSRAGQFRGCGVNIKLLQVTDAPTRDYLTLSLNFWIDSPGVSLAKTTWSKATIGGSSRVSPQRLDSTWARIKEKDPLRAEKTTTGEDQAILTVVPLDQAIDFVTAVLGGEQEIQVGFKPHMGKYERIFYGKPVIEHDTASQVQACFGEFIKRLNRGSNESYQK